MGTLYVFSEYKGIVENWIIINSPLKIIINLQIIVYLFLEPFKYHRLIILEFFFGYLYTFTVISIISLLVLGILIILREFRLLI